MEIHTHSVEWKCTGHKGNVYVAKTGEHIQRTNTHFTDFGADRAEAEAFVATVIDGSARCAQGFTPAPHQGWGPALHQAPQIHALGMSTRVSITL